MYIYVEAELAHCTRVQCSEGESSSTHLSFAYVVLSASYYTNRQHISHISLSRGGHSHRRNSHGYDRGHNL